MSRRDEAERRQDLRATSDSLRDDASRLSQIEADKRDLEPGDPRLTEQSREAERLAVAIEHKSRVERDLSEGGDGDEDRSD
jgi:hypothetical protein